MKASTDQSTLCYHLQRSLCVLVTTHPALPPTPSSSEATAITPSLPPTLLPTTATPNKPPLLLLLQHRRASAGYLNPKPSPTRTAPPSTSTPKTTIRTTTTLRACEWPETDGRGNTKHYCYNEFWHWCTILWLSNHPGALIFSVFITPFCFYCTTWLMSGSRCDYETEGPTCRFYWSVSLCAVCRLPAKPVSQADTAELLDSENGESHSGWAC